MFSNNRKDEAQAISPETYASANTVIAKGVKVEGDFNSEGDVVIEGEVKGALKTSSSLTVGGDALISADVHAATASVSGTIEGNLTVQNELVVTSSAVIKGDVTAETMSVERGARLDGKVAIGSSSEMGSGRQGVGNAKKETTKKTDTESSTESTEAEE